MFSIVFPGQGSQIPGMSKELYLKYDLVKKIYKQADEILEFPISNLILDGPKEKLNLTENTQPSIFLVSYAIFQVATKEFNHNLLNANFFAGHSLGEYSALACSEAISFPDTLKLLKIRGRAMQNSLGEGEGGMVAVLGSDLDKINEILMSSNKNYACYIANDNSNHQIVVSGLIKDLEMFTDELNKNKIKNIKLQVSAPFHCSLMKYASGVICDEIKHIEINDPKNNIISNVTASLIEDKSHIKDLLIQQIENKVRWRESINYMITRGTKKFIEIGPGKVLSNLIKRIDKNMITQSINNDDEIKNLNLND